MNKGTALEMAEAFSTDCMNGLATLGGDAEQIVEYCWDEIESIQSQLSAATAEIERLKSILTKFAPSDCPSAFSDGDFITYNFPFIAGELINPDSNVLKGRKASFDPVLDGLIIKDYRQARAALKDKDNDG